MSHRAVFKIAMTLLISAHFALIGCATSLPPSMVIKGQGPHMMGSVAAMAGDGDRIVMASSKGVFIKVGENQRLATCFPVIYIPCYTTIQFHIYPSNIGQIGKVKILHIKVKILLIIS